MKILIVAPAWVGDAVMAQSLFKVLQQRYKNCTIDVLAPAWSEPLLSRMPQVNRAIAFPIGHGELALAKRFAIGRDLSSANKNAPYDQAIVLPNSLKSALVPFWAKIPQRTGWRGEMRYGLLNDLRVLDKKRYPLMVERFVALAYPKEAMPQQLVCPKPELLVDKNCVQKLRQQFDLEESWPVLALCPGAEFGPAKQWPAEHYAKLAANKCEQGYQVWLFGSDKDKVIADRIVSLIDQSFHHRIYNLSGRTKLGEAIDLLSEAAVVVSNDSGLMHISAALHRPLAVVYGATSPDFTPPLSDNHVFVKSQIACSPCFKRTCPLGHGDCLKKMLPEQVEQRLNQLPIVTANHNTKESISGA